MFPKSNKTGQFDSDLEMCWTHLLKSQGLSITHHPGDIYNPNTGEYYEPDLLIHQEPQILAEVKGYKDHRVNKLKDLSTLTGLPGVYLLPPHMPLTASTNGLQRPFAHWQGVDLSPMILVPYRGFYRLSEVVEESGFASVQTYARLSPELKERFSPLEFPHKTDIKEQQHGAYSQPQQEL